MQVERGIETDNVTLVYCVPNIFTRKSGDWKLGLMIKIRIITVCKKENLKF